MPRKAKDVIVLDAKSKNELVEKKPQKDVEKKVKTTKKATTVKTTTANTTSKSSKKNLDKTEKVVKSTTKKVKETSSKTKKTTSTKTKEKEQSKTKTENKSKTKRSTKKINTVKPSKRVIKSSVDILEYYDLPYRYNKTVIKLLAQTPTSLFVYWEISDADREKYIKEYGENFFNDTKPVLQITNETMNYSFEVDINDFANCWYLHVNDSKCVYKITLGRRPINHSINIPNNYLFITDSNELEAPNNHILIDSLGHSVFFKNVKNNTVTKKDIHSFSFMQRIGKLYNIYNLYQELYGDEDIINLDNPSSGNPTSTVK